MPHKRLAALPVLALVAASCDPAATEKTAPSKPAVSPVTAALPEVEGFRSEVVGNFSEPWAMALLPDGESALVTEKRGRLRLWLRSGQVLSVAGTPEVDYGGDGGLGDVILAPDFATSGTIYLSWADPGPGDVRGAAVGKARLVLDASPRIEDFTVLWRQAKVRGHGHYSHRLAISPDRRWLYVSSGDRRFENAAQNPLSELGKILRFDLTATNPRLETVSLGHRNVLGLKFDDQGRLWGLEHGPTGGDELNHVVAGGNYGWPKVSEGDDLEGRRIPRHDTRPEFAAPAISWNPVIAPGDFIFYRGAMFPEWRGQALIAGLRSQSVVRVEIRGEIGHERARYSIGNRLREIVEDRDGALLVLEDGPYGRLLRLTRR